MNEHDLFRGFQTKEPLSPSGSFLYPDSQKSVYLPEEPSNFHVTGRIGMIRRKSSFMSRSNTSSALVDARADFFIDSRYLH